MGNTRELTRPQTSDKARSPAQGKPLRLFDPFSFLQSEIERVFDNFNGDLSDRSGTWPTFWPKLEMSEDDKAIDITVELPGMEEKDVEISIAGDFLNIRGEKRSATDDKSRSYRIIERSYGAFERSIKLPPGIDTSDVKARMSNGVLHVSIPQPAGAKGQKIKISNS